MKTNDERYRSLYNKHVLSLSPFIYDELKAYSDPTLATIIIMSIIIMGDPYYRLSYTCGASANYYYGGLARSLRIIEIAAALSDIDHASFNFSSGNGHWAAILPDLFVQAPTHELRPGGQEYTEAARRILVYLCQPGPHALVSGH